MALQVQPSPNPSTVFKWRHICFFRGYQAHEEQSDLRLSYFYNEWMEETLSHAVLTLKIYTNREDYTDFGLAIRSILPKDIKVVTDSGEGRVSQIWIFPKRPD